MKKICICTMIILIVLCTAAYALSGKQEIDVNANLGNANISVSGEIDVEEAFKEATMVLLKPGKSVEELSSLSDENTFTDIIAGYYQTSVDENSEYVFEDFKLKSGSGWHTIIISTDNKQYTARKFLPDMQWINSRRSDMNSNMYQVLEDNKNELIDITDIDIYYSFNDVIKSAISNEVVSVGLKIKLDDVVEDVIRTTIKKDILTTSSVSTLRQYLFPDELTESQYTEYVKEVIDISERSNLSTIKYFLGLNSTGEKDKVLKKVVELNKSSIEDVIGALNISVIEYKIKNASNWAEVFGIIETHKDVFTTLNFDAYKNSSRRSEIDKSLLSKNSSSTIELGNYINEEVRRPIINSDSGFGKPSGTAGTSGTGGMASVGSVGGNQSVGATNSIFKDISSCAWAKDAIEYLYSKGIVAGTGVGNYSPNAYVTREAFVKMLVMATNTQSEGTIEFEDVSENAWYYEYVNAAVNSGIVHGYSDKIFGSGENIKREDMAAMISSVIGDIEAIEEINFVDAGEISEYAKSGVSKASALGIINGFEDSTFKPKAYCTRAQAAVVIYNLIKVGGYNG